MGSRQFNSLADRVVAHISDYSVINSNIAHNLTLLWQTQTQQTNNIYISFFGGGYGMLYFIAILTEILYFVAFVNKFKQEIKKLGAI